MTRLPLQPEQPLPRQGAAIPVTIVMATYNGARYLPAQLASFARQSHADWSLLVSDDGSSDETLALLQAFAQRHPVQIIRGPQRGAAQNFLSALAHPALTNRHIALSDQDDVWRDDRLSLGLAALAGLEGAALFASESILTDAELRPLSRSRMGRVRPGFAASLSQNLFAGHAMLMTPAARAMVVAAGLPQEVAYHDWWIYQLLAGAGAKLVLSPEPSVLYRQHGRNVLGGAHGLSAGLRRLQMVFSGAWGAKMRQQAEALAQREAMLTPEARSILAQYLAAPAWGLARRQRFVDLGIRRSGRLGDLCLQSAAVLGRV